MTYKEHEIVIIGGGTAGITVAAQLLLKDKSLDIAIIDPADEHYYQAAWTLVGGGTFENEETARPMKECMPPRATWLQTAVESLDPENNQLTTSNNTTITYQYLVVAAGIQVDWHKVKGLTDTLNKNNVCSNYGYEYAPYTWEVLKNFKGGNVIFTQPNTPIKCGGAPQKIAYLADEALRKNGVRNKSEINFYSPGGVIFGVEVFARTLKKVNERKNINWNFKHNLKEVRGEVKEAIFDITDDKGNVTEKTVNFDMMHVVPPMSAPDFIKNSPLAKDGDALGWVDVDIHTLQHNKFANVFSLGDVAGLPTAKTGSAIRKQSPLVVENLLCVKNNKSIEDNKKYNGYSSCPLVTGYGKMVLAEFDYQNQPDVTFPVDQSQERYDMWILKKFGLPWMYWNLMLRGKA